VPLKLPAAPTPVLKSWGAGGATPPPHNFTGNYVPEEYLPDALRGQRFYAPSQSGEEANIADRLENWRRQAEQRRAGEEQAQAAEDDAARKLDPSD
jgi:putative ATPase